MCLGLSADVLGLQKLLDIAMKRLQDLKSSANPLGASKKTASLSPADLLERMDELKHRCAVSLTHAPSKHIVLAGLSDTRHGSLPL